jgi:hypothetical protein
MVVLSGGFEQPFLGFQNCNSRLCDLDATLLPGEDKRPMKSHNKTTRRALQQLRLRSEEWKCCVMRGVSAKNCEGRRKAFHQRLYLCVKALHAGKVVGHRFPGFKLQVVNFIDYVCELVVKKSLGEL